MLNPLFLKSHLALCALFARFSPLNNRICPQGKLHKIQIDLEACRDWIVLERNFDIYLVVISLSLYKLHSPASVYAFMCLFAPIASAMFFPLSYLPWRMMMNQGDGLVNDE